VPTDRVVGGAAEGLAIGAGDFALETVQCPSRLRDVLVADEFFAGSTCADRITMPSLAPPVNVGGVMAGEVVAESSVRGINL